MVKRRGTETEGSIENIVRRVGGLPKFINFLNKGLNGHAPPHCEALCRIETYKLLEVIIGGLVHFGFFERLSAFGRFSKQDFAVVTGFAPRSATATLEVLHAADLIVERSGRPGTFELSTAAKCYLVRESPFYKGEFFPKPKLTRKLSDSLFRGEVGGDGKAWAQGKSIEEEKWAISMHALSFPLGLAMKEKHFVGPRDRLLDIGGGAGSVAIALALDNPHLDCTIVDLPKMCAQAARYLRAFSLSDRVTLLPGNMFELTWPSGFDTVVFTNIFHDWNDERCQTLARKAHASLKPGGMILLNEALLNEREPGPLFTALFSFSMAQAMQGRQFRGSELQDFCKSAGFTDFQIVPLHGHYSTVMARRPKSRIYRARTRHLTSLTPAPAPARRPARVAPPAAR